MPENTHTVESGAAFADETDADISVTATFIQAGEQLQHVFIGLEPVLLVQPEYDAEAHSVEFILTAVDLAPPALVQVLELLLDSAKEMVKQDMAILEEGGPLVDSSGHEHILSADCPCGPTVESFRDPEQEEADAALRKANEDFDLAQLPETPEG